MGLVATLVAQVNEGFYRDHYPKKEGFYCDRYSTTYVFPLLAMMIFGCLRYQVNNFFHRCANMVWIVKGIGGPHLSMLFSFHR